MQMYNEILDSRSGGFGAGEPTKDIYRKMAPLHTKLENYAEAAKCLMKVIEEEDQEILKVGHLTKVAGNFKKANDEEACVKASHDAYELMKKLSGDKDA